MTTFQNGTIADLQDKIRALREVLSSHEAEASHHRERHSYYQGLASRSRASLDDYECLLGYAEAVNANPASAEVEAWSDAYGGVTPLAVAFGAANADDWICVHCGIHNRDHGDDCQLASEVNGR